MTRAADPRIGTDLGSYRIEAVIGRGGMGVVYRAEQLGLARKVALKILAPVLVDDEAFRQRFVRESQMAAAIDHPNILPIYEAGEVDGVYFLAMRFVDGADLETRLRSGPLEPPQAVRLLGQVASALDAAGEAGLVHRDVKPANILIASSRGIEKADHAYLSDFGLTKHRGSQTGLTQTGAFMGTLDYVAPEQVEGRPVDSRTDQYSLACVAFHCLTGVTPFPRDTDIAIAMAHLHDPPPSASSVRPELPPAVDAVLAKGMAKRPDDRYPTSEAFALALREALGVRVSEPHPIPPTTVTARPRRLVLTLGLGVIAIIAIGVVGFALVGRGSLPGSSPSAETGQSDPSTATLGSPQASPTEAPFTLLESSLTLSLPEASVRDCARGDAALLKTQQGPSVKPRAHVVCQMVGGTGPDVVDAWLLPQLSDLRGSDIIAAMAIASAVEPGECATDGERVGEWYIPDTELYGRVLCRPSPDGNGAELDWSVDDPGVVYMAVEQGGDHAALFNWWLANREEISP